VIISFNNEGSRVASLASWSTCSFSRISEWPRHHMALRVLIGLFCSYYSICW